MNILFLSTVNDANRSYGGSVYTHAIVDMLRSIKAVQKVTEVYYFNDIRESNLKMNKIIALLRSAFADLPAKCIYYRNTRYADRVAAELEKNDYDIVVIEHAELLWVLDLLRAGQKVVYIAQNVEHVVYGQVVSRYASFPLAGRFLARDAKKMKDYEIDAVKRTENIIAISTDDMQYWKKMFPDLNGIAINPYFKYSRQDKVKRTMPNRAVVLGFMGNMTWLPNREAVEWFVNKVYSKIFSAYELHLFGRGTEKYSSGGTGIIGHGFVNDISEIWQTVDIMINPIVSGGGVNIKVAEAIYNKMPMICSPEAMKGLQLLPDESIMILESADQWVHTLKNDEKIARLMNCASFVNAEKFAFTNYVEEMSGYLNSVIAS